VDPKRSLFRLSAESILQPTALVHEAWLKLAGEPAISMASRRQFYVLASRMMRGILVDHVRRGQTTKRGGSQIEIPLSEANAAEQPRCVDFLVLDQAMRLDEIRSRYQEIVELRFMAGLTPSRKRRSSWTCRMPPSSANGISLACGAGVNWGRRVRPNDT
jgi:RNA polymerase sigma-70 factor, ECF subfamily